MVEILTRLGFRMFGKCNCGGRLTHKYKRGNVIVKYYPKRETANILMKSVTYYREVGVDEIEGKIGEVIK